jgi:glutamyl-tRNA synthetase
MEDHRKLLRKYALMNAIKHKGIAQNGAVIGMFMNFHPEMKSKAQKIIKIVEEVVTEINSTDVKTQMFELEKIGDKLEDKKIEKKGLFDLPKSDKKIVLRFAPNPSGPLHIGHARAAIMNHEYVNRYKGKLILRIEDTDPRRVELDAYNMIEEDLNWLGVQWHEKIIQSDRIQNYYKYAKKLIKLGFAYVCKCKGIEFKKLKDNSEPCPCRNSDIDKNLILWNQMANFDEGEAVLRIKTDLNHKNPAIRDWVAMRIVEQEHPRIGSEFRIYPMMNFAVAIDDYLLGITHVLRGKDHLANTEKQKYIYQHFGWEMPFFIHYGRLKMEDIPLSTSKTRKGIEEGMYCGWDDPRLGTIRAIARRGITRKAIYNLINEIGVKIADSTITWKKIYGLNRAVLEKTANRYFFVWDPLKIIIENLPEKFKRTVRRSYHPDFPERGYRKIPFDGEVYIVSKDIDKRKILRLMDAVNIYFELEKAIYHSEGISEARNIGAKLVQWVPINNNIKAKIIMPNALVINGFIEPSIAGLKVGDVVQFERCGFARLDNLYNGTMCFYFAHK